MGCANPLSDAELTAAFGTTRPTQKMVEESDGFWESLERGQAVYILLYENDAPCEIFFVGYSFD